MINVCFAIAPKCIISRRILLSLNCITLTVIFNNKRVHTQRNSSVKEALNFEFFPVLTLKYFKYIKDKEIP